MDKHNISSSSLFTNPTFASGIARMGDYFGTINEYNYSTSGEEADKKGLARDWAMVGSDLNNAFHTYESETMAKISRVMAHFSLHL